MAACDLTVKRPPLRSDCGIVDVDADGGLVGGDPDVESV